MNLKNLNVKVLNANDSIDLFEGILLLLAHPWTTSLTFDFDMLGLVRVEKRLWWWIHPLHPESTFIQLVESCSEQACDTNQYKTRLCWT